MQNSVRIAVRTDVDENREEETVQLVIATDDPSSEEHMVDIQDNERYGANVARSEPHRIESEPKNNDFSSSK
jgi:hypothetical protein